MVGEDGRLEAVAPAVLDGRLDGEFVDVDALGSRRAEQQGRDGQDAAAAAEVQDGLAALYGLFEGLQTEAGSLVRAGAEGEAGLEVECFTLGRRFNFR